MAAIVPFFSLSPMHPSATTYDPGRTDLPFAYASLLTYGGHTVATESESLASQADRDQIVLKWDPVPLSEVTASSQDDFRHHCAVRIAFGVHNVTRDRQYLMLFSVQGRGSVQTFLDYDLLRSEALSMRDDTIAILMDCPGSGVYVYVSLRLASSEADAFMTFKGMDCYLL